MARKPITCGIALRRVIIIRNASITLAMAIPSVDRVTVLASCWIGAARLKAKTTSTMPISMVVGMLSSPSTSQRTSSLRTKRCRSHGSRATLTISVKAAEPYRCVCPVAQATIAVEHASAKPCAAKRLISVNTRRCASIAKASSSRTAASRLISWAQSGMPVIARSLAAQQQVDQHAQHGEQKRRAEKLGCAEDAHLRRQRFDQCQAEAAQGELDDQHRSCAKNRAHVGVALRDTEGQEQGQTDAGVIEQLQRRGPFDERQVPRRVLKDHRLVDHR